MQNPAMHTLHTTYRTDILRKLALACLCAAIGALAMLVTVVAPVQAFADAGYTMSSVNIRAQIETDGTAHIVEQRTFIFTRDCDVVTWQLDSLQQAQSINISSVRVAREEGGAVEGDWEMLTRATFDMTWRDGVIPDEHKCSLDTSENKLYVFFEASPGTMVVEVDYTIENFAQAWEDNAQIYWRYYSADWPADAENVTMALVLPVPADTIVTPGETVKAWGHGPECGNVSINPDGSVVYAASVVDSGEYGEARILFPKAWLTNLDLRALRLHNGERITDTALQDEASWIDSSALNAVYGRQFDIVCVCLGAAVMLVVLAIYLVWGRKLKPETGEDARAEVSEQLQQMNPAVLMRLARWNQRSDDDLEFAFTPQNPPSDEEARDWQGKLDEQVAKAQVFDVKSFKARKALLILAALCLVVAFILSRATGGRTTPLVVGIITAAACALVANYMPRRTQKGENIAQALSKLGADVNDTDADGAEVAEASGAAEVAEGAEVAEATCAAEAVKTTQTAETVREQ